MNGLRIKDLLPQGYLACDLRDFLALLGEEARPLCWRVSGDVWATGGRSEELKALADSDMTVANDKFAELVHTLTQVIDGEFLGYQPGEDQPWVIIRAIDSSYYEFFCREPGVLHRARDRFVEVTDC